MKKYNFDLPINRRGTNSVKWDGMPAGTASDTLPLWVADMDFAAADPIVEALHRRADHGVFGYSRYEGGETKGAVSGWFQRRFGWEIAHDELFFCAGVVPALGILIRILSEAGDGIVIQPPVYHPFANKIIGNDRRVVENPLICRDGVYEIDFVDLEDKLSQADVKGLIFCSPHNPTGRVWSADEVERVAEICAQQDKWIISDEIHCDILREGVAHHPMLKCCPQHRERIIACTAPSKTFNLAGLQISNIVIPSKEYQRSWKQETEVRLGLLDASPFALAAMVAAYNDGEEWLTQVSTYIDANITFAVDFFAKQMPQAQLTMPEGTYLLWVDFQEYVEDEWELEMRVRQEARVALNEGYIFGKQGAGFERINVACSRSILTQGLKRIKSALNGDLEKSKNDL